MALTQEVYYIDIIFWVNMIDHKENIFVIKTDKVY